MCKDMPNFRHCVQVTECFVSKDMASIGMLAVASQHNSSFSLSCGVLFVCLLFSTSNSTLSLLSALLYNSRFLSLNHVKCHQKKERKFEYNLSLLSAKRDTPFPIDVDLLISFGVIFWVL